MSGFLHCAILLTGCLVLCAPEVQAYCWQIGHNPEFTGPPKAEQVDLRTVRISWFGLVSYRHCTDQFLIKYWQKSDPIDYKLTDLVSKEVNSIDIEVTPKVEYTFQVVAREDKGIVGGIDYNYSPTVDFKTSAYNPEVKGPPEVINIGGGGGNDRLNGLNSLDTPATQINSVKPSSDPRSVPKRPEDKDLNEVNLSIELIAIIVVCSVVFILIVIGIIYKLACAQKSQDDQDDDDDDDDDDEDDIPEKEKFEA